MTRRDKGRLVFVVNVDWFFLSHRLPIALAAQKDGYEVHLVTTLTEHETTLEKYGFIVHPVVIDRSSAGLIGLTGLLLKFIRIFRSVEPDLVHLVTIKPVLIGGLAARITRVPAVVYAVSGLGHVFVANTMAGRLRRALVGRWYRLILGVRNMRIIFQNPDDRHAIESITRILPDRVEMIPGSGVDLSEYDYRPMPEGEPIVLMAARLLRTKGVEEFVQAARLVKRKHPLVRFLLVGSPDHANPTSISNAELAEWKAEGVVELLGHRSDIPELMREAHIVALPSFYGEGLPKVLIEAAACGRAVVTTDMPGCRDAIENGVTGLLVTPENANELATTLLMLIEDRHRCIEMGKAGRQRAEAIFDIQAVVQKHLNIYKDLRDQV